MALRLFSRLPSALRARSPALLTFSTSAPVSRAPLARTSVLLRCAVRGESTGSDHKSPFSWKSVLVLVFVGGAYISYFQLERDKIKQEKEERKTKAIGQASIGGPFSLVNTKGQLMTDKDFRGKWLLLYFGFTFCPDICPEELNKITAVANDFAKREDKKGELVPVFISVDPHRDSPEKISEYLKDFHPSFVGLTGSDEQLRGITKAFRVYYSKPPNSDDPDYLVDHSIMTYLIDPAGNFAAYFGQNVSAEDISNAIARNTRTWTPPPEATTGAESK